MKNPLLCISAYLVCLFTANGQTLDGYSAIFNSNKDITYIGPSFKQDELILVVGEDVVLFNTTNNKITTKIHIDFLGMVHEIVLLDSAKQEILINVNMETNFHQDYGRLPIGMLRVSFSEKKLLAFLDPAIRIGPNAFHKNNLFFVWHNWVTLDSVNFWVNKGTLYNTKDSTQRIFEKQFISSYCVTPNRDKIIAGTEKGKLYIMDAQTLEVLHIDSSHNDAIIRIQSTKENIVFGGPGGKISVLDAEYNLIKSIPLANELSANFQISTDGKSLIADVYGGKTTFFRLNGDSFYEFHFRYPIMVENCFYMMNDSIAYFLEIGENSTTNVIKLNVNQQRINHENYEQNAKTYAVQKTIENNLIEVEFLTAADTLKNEVMINQITERLYLDYLPKMYTDSGHYYGLLYDEKTAYIFHIPSGRLLKKFSFPNDIELACMNKTGDQVAFYIPYKNSQYERLDKFVVYDFSLKKGKVYSMPEACKEAYSCSPDSIFFNSSSSHLMFTTLAPYSENKVNALNLIDGNYAFIDSQNQHIFSEILSKEEFKNSKFYDVIENQNEPFTEFSVKKDQLFISRYGSYGLNMSLNNLQLQSQYSLKFCGHEIFNTSTWNPIWDKIGLKHGEYDWSYSFTPEIVNDSIFTFFYEKTWYVVNARNLTVIRKENTGDDVFLSRIYLTEDQKIGFYFIRMNALKTESYILTLDPVNGKSSRLDINKVMDEIPEEEDYYRTDSDFGITPFNFIGLMPNGQLVLSNYDYYFVYDYLKHEVIKTQKYLGSYVQTSVYDKDLNLLFIGTDNGNIFMRDSAGETNKFASGSPGIIMMQYVGKDLFVLTKDNRISVYDIQQRKLKAWILFYRNQSKRYSAAVFTPDLYYTAEKSGIQNLHISAKDKQIYNINQFELIFNRPDKVFKALGYTGESTLEAFSKAYKRRLKKLNMNADDFNGDISFPELSIENRTQISPKTNDKNLLLKLNAQGMGFPLQRYIVKLNNVPVLSPLFELKNCNCINTTSNLNIELLEGNNQISISVLNSRGFESFQNLIEIEYVPKKPATKRLYLITIGVNEYKNPEISLTYAGKDAINIDSFFRQNNAFYDTIISMQLLNEEFSRENLKRLKTELLKSTPEDAVMLTYAGHGALDSTLNYFLGTYDFDLNHPETHGIAYEELENLMNDIPAMRKAIWIDACHSGELDKEDMGIVEAGTNKTEKGDRGSVLKVKNETGAQTGELARDMFADLRTGTGTTVISASGGLEQAKETNELQNGLFTYCLLDGLRTKYADRNGDGQIWLSELKNYVEEEVVKKSEGTQRPTSRIDNLFFDFRLY